MRRSAKPTPSLDRSGARVGGDDVVFHQALRGMFGALHAVSTHAGALQLVCTHARRLFAVRSAAVFLRREGQWYAAAQDGPVSFFDAACLTSGGPETPLASAWQSERSLSLGDAGSPTSAPGWILLCALRGQRGAEAVLVLYGLAGADQVDDRLRQRAELFAAQAALAADNAQLLEDLSRADQLKSDFLAAVSHDLRTPLNVIVGYTDIQMDGLLGPTTPEQHDALRRVRSTALNLAGFIATMLDLNRLDAGRMPVQRTALDMAQMQNELWHTLEDHPDWGRVPLQWRCGPVPALLGDPEKIKLILRNLISNAVKFTPTGSITVTLAYASEPQQLQLTVADTGTGIAPADLPHVFTRFHRGGTGTHSVGGVGLGLYLVRRIVELLGGTITATSNVGVGSTFEVSVPAALSTTPVRAC